MTAIFKHHSTVVRLIVIFIFIFVFWTGFSGSAGTPPARLFSPAQFHPDGIRAPSPAPASPSPPPPPTASPPADANPHFKADFITGSSWLAGTGFSTRDAEQYEWMNSSPLLQRSDPPQLETSGVFPWIEQNLFAMDSIPLGKVELGGGLITAIHRKNPLCLINPIVFAVGW